MASSARRLSPVSHHPDAEIRQQDLLSGEASTDSRPAPLWLAAHFPWLAGEVLHDGREPPQAVSEEKRQGWLIYRASPEAQRRGVLPGMSVSAAGVICPGMPVRRRQPKRERQRLAAIADRLLRFSPVVSVQPPETVLLEIRGSLTLFGGLERLKKLIETELEAAEHVHRLAGAPTPAAAGCLALWGRERIVEERSALRSVLGAMPVALLGLDDRTAGRLARAGLRTLRDLWRLPIDGLARRFGTTLVRKMDRLRGRRPDPRPLHESALRFSSVLMLDWATDDLVQVERGVEHLLDQWVAELRRSARGTSGFTIECLPERGNDVLRVEIGLRRISRDKEHLRRLAAERLSRVRLDAPVSGLVLASDRLHSLTGHNGRLFDGDQEAVMQWQQSEELLAMHLGGRGLDGLETAAEHRPELAWRTASPVDRPRGETAVARGARPLWLLDPPRPLPWPRRLSRQRLDLRQGPERIETGWWDRGDQRRDYYAAIDRRGRRLWVFWDLRHRRWYLHGLFS